MPIPKPKGESKNDYISKCVSSLMKKEGKEQKQALAICFNTWEREMNEQQIIEDYVKQIKKLNDPLNEEKVDELNMSNIISMSVDQSLDQISDTLNQRKQAWEKRSNMIMKIDMTPDELWAEFLGELEKGFSKRMKSWKKMKLRTV